MAYKTRTLALAAAGLAATMTALPAVAHPGHGGGAGMMAGFLHPLTGLDHLLALLALGLWSRQQRSGFVLPPVFLALMALGASCVAMVADGMLPALEMSIAATVLLLGALAASALRLPPQIAVLLASLCGFLHGLAHGRELAGMPSGAGFLLASALVMGLGIVVRPDEQRRRIAGAAIGAAGLCLLTGLV
ncbi:HupE/UreJ family protein [Massilia aerilata]|uniref:HupE/UreJ family protein n=1 Tax=Massilia aerilata TaxID=453817 RepID=A0ABW0RTG5_9BURK